LGGSGGQFGELLTVLYEHGFSSVPLPLAEQAIACRILAEADPASSVLGACLDGTIRITVSPKTEVGPDEGLILRAVPWATDAEAVLVTMPHDKTSVALVSLEGADIQAGTNLAREDRSDVVLGPTSEFGWRGELKDADRVLVLGAAARSAQIAGAARRCLEYATAYAAVRRQFGKPIGEFQAVAHHLARMSELCSGADAALGVLCAEGDADPYEVAATKVWMGRTAFDVARLAHQVHGAIGITKEHPLHRSTLRLRAWSFEFGSPVEWERFLGERVVADVDQWWMQAPLERLT
jgi:acyl-CoA dehydrogenase